MGPKWELLEPRHRVYVPRDPSREWSVHHPILPSEMKVSVLGRRAHHVRDVDGAASCRVYQELALYREGAPVVIEKLYRGAIPQVRDVSDAGPPQERDTILHEERADGPRHEAIVHDSIGLRMKRPGAPHLRFDL